MALDGAFLHHLREELSEKLVGARVDKIFQPNRDEMIFVLRGFDAQYRLLLSARANSARVNLTAYPVENPAQPPMLCMLLRKRLSGAKLLSIEQPDLERVLLFTFSTTNELGDRVELVLAVEVMGRYSNIILVDENGKIVDALRRVDAEMSSERVVLPGLLYRLPPPQDKVSMLTDGPEAVLEKIDALPKDMELSRALNLTMQGVSPIVARELQHSIGRGGDVFIRSMDAAQRERAIYFLRRLSDTVRELTGTPYAVLDAGRRPKDFSYIDIHQYGTSMIVSKKESFSQLLDDFYGERDRMERMRVKSQDLLRLLTNHTERLRRKMQNQRQELADCARRDEYRIKGDVLSANLFAVEKGAKRVTLPNFYDENGGSVEIALDPALSPQQNAQRYYKNYRKAKTAEEKLTEQIAIAERDLEYLDSVLESLAMAETERDLNEIRAELAEQGYTRAQRTEKNGKKNPRGGKSPAVSAPMRFETSDGFTVLVGRNNRQNDRLTLKDANNNDIWFHTKNIPGSHTVLVSDGKKPTETAMREAAVLAAKHSRARDSAQVPVDYTEVRHVSKPQGAKPGMVIYVQYRTVYVDPNEAKPASAE